MDIKAFFVLFPERKTPELQLRYSPIIILRNLFHKSEPDRSGSQILNYFLTGFPLIHSICAYNDCIAVLQTKGHDPHKALCINRLPAALDHDLAVVSACCLYKHCNRSGIFLCVLDSNCFLCHDSPFPLIRMMIIFSFPLHYGSHATASSFSVRGVFPTNLCYNN